MNLQAIFALCLSCASTSTTCHQPHLDAHVKCVQTLQLLKGDGDGVPSPTVGAPNAKAAINADAAHTQVQRRVSKNELQEAQGRCAQSEPLHKPGLTAGKFLEQAVSLSLYQAGV